ncbi:hypothetical protein D3C78_1021650 [compost metagenome]
MQKKNWVSPFRQHGIETIFLILLIIKAASKRITTYSSISDCKPWAQIGHL